mmetsp:Transcript_13027/g.28779  ORF Transcript_13027/g.28779 Transcript_13027/m.28779 type:complete len:103 (+) Transcript_13027:1161-1469(+)
MKRALDLYNSAPTPKLVADSTSPPANLDDLSYLISLASASCMECSAMTTMCLARSDARTKAHSTSSAASVSVGSKQSLSRTRSSSSINPASRSLSYTQFSSV